MAAYLPKVEETLIRLKHVNPQDSWARIRELYCKSYATDHYGTEGARKKKYLIRKLQRQAREHTFPDTLNQPQRVSRLKYKSSCNTHISIRAVRGLITPHREYLQVV
jgi:hypothetical protein